MRSVYGKTSVRPSTSQNARRLFSGSAIRSKKHVYNTHNPEFFTEIGKTMSEEPGAGRPAHCMPPAGGVKGGKNLRRARRAARPAKLKPCGFCLPSLDAARPAAS